MSAAATHAAATHAAATYTAASYAATIHTTMIYTAGYAAYAAIALASTLAAGLGRGC